MTEIRSRLAHYDAQVRDGIVHDQRTRFRMERYRLVLDGVPENADA